MTVTMRTKIIVGIAAVAIVVAGGAVIASRAGAPTTAAASPVHAGSAGRLQDPVADAPSAAKKKVTAMRVRIPAIGVDTKLIPLTLKPHSDQLKAPLDFNVAGWYVNGTVPGDIGPAVIDGHVDSPTAPGVFLHLRRVTAGDRILVTLSTGVVKTFVVDSTRAAPKNNFPTDAVYGPTPTPQLRVITCDGAFDRATGHYLDNLVVFASLLS
jgi:sortase (surface protein transpeptidase)